MENQDNLLGVLSSLYKWRKRIILISVVAFVGSILISLMMPNYYKASTTFYAASIDLTKPEKVFGHSTTSTKYYGGDNERSRILSLSYSDEFIQFMVDTFDLYKHYEIDSTKENARFKMNKTFLKLFSVKETKHESLVLTIEDTNRALAQEMANVATQKINKMGQYLNKVSQNNIIKMMSNNLKEHEELLKSVGDSLVTLRKQYGIYNIESQSELIASLVAKSESSLASKEAELKYLNKNRSFANRDTIVKITSKIKGLQSVLYNLTSSNSTSNFNLKRFNDGIAEVEVLANMHAITRNSYAYEKQTVAEYITVNNSIVPAIHLMSSASLPMKKSKPTRSIIVLASTFAAFIFSCLGILLFESYRRFNWDTIKDA